MGNITKPVLYYGITPTRDDISEEKIIDITSRRIERISKLPIDGLVVYDVQDESLRNDEERPFPYIPTIDAYTYVDKYLSDVKVNKIIYKPVSSITKEVFVKWLNNAGDYSYVFVGSPSNRMKPELTLDQAYKIISDEAPKLNFGAIMIPERHFIKKNEHERVINKALSKADFFISQCVYNSELTKNYLSDYYYTALERNIDIKRQIFTFTPCGSPATLKFMKWLGINIPVWLENELLHTENILDKSLELTIKNAGEIIEFCKEKNIPFGINIESVSVKKEEIEASVYLVNTVSDMLRR